MAVPKRKMSRSNTRARRSQWKTTATTLTTCPQCKAHMQPHIACPSCGAYNGRRYAEAVRSEHEAS
ncbi:50S ribosomal protein L32 [Cellulomonas shaoxiangyii]|uniref:Large ribosomal subunit protein bL32 n=1 Tax=Cellulomonas shaoxiangyii TaxID=2566013 RepID=A0A4P7SHY2_9CELL|nr:50S ribosomal protein L32 [Cellulomonas shaoxiangyii]QCB93198.1 50S ribosomal protein L32 [Cellulomonas shaoxiangyii]TGY80682.1 50S ribosomal protein L32 [Cellulomonas shaoxiangyii]